MPDVANEDASRRFIFEDDRPATEVREVDNVSGSVLPIDRPNDVAEESPPRRRSEATPYDLKLEILGCLLYTSPSPRDS